MCRDGVIAEGVRESSADVALSTVFFDCLWPLFVILAHGDQNARDVTCNDTPRANCKRFVTVCR